ncbi:acyltransferase family protein [Paenibacillus harenae]|uniref:acyltransferase family protein n=1 Tax=Paenibacillus harenae TaxID=306543 RepID=UPI0006878F45|nr:acyltransferase [Paenibacillus harenae]
MKPNYSGLDWLKFMAALLVVANHTGPLQSINPYADFLISGVLTRIAVPVFFMTSGFFFFRKLTGDPAADPQALHGYAKKVGKLYVIAILLYIPLNLYTGYFTTDFSVYSFMKDIVFDGTVYHLWYLPAMLTGLYMTYFLYKRMPMKAMLAAACSLYAIGLLGGSYYGFMEGNKGLTQIYDGMFNLFDYTRNGLFYAPVFLALGAWASKQPKRERSAAAQAGLFAASLILMFAEGILLNAADIPRHDGMYIFAIPAAYYLFQWALHWRGKSGKAFRDWRVWIYILHPYAIVLVRGASEAVHLEHLFIANRLLHFLAVCLLSIIIASAAVKLEHMRRPRPSHVDA